MSALARKTPPGRLTVALAATAAQVLTGFALAKGEYVVAALLVVVAFALNAVLLLAAEVEKAARP